MSPGSLPRLKPARCRKGEVVGNLLGRDLREELERLGAEAQHHPLTTPAVQVEEEEQEDQFTWYGGGERCAHTNPHT